MSSIYKNINAKNECVVQCLNGESLRIVCSLEFKAIDNADIKNLECYGKEELEPIIEDYISNNLLRAIYSAVTKVSDDEYILNVCPGINHFIHIDSEIPGAVRNLMEAYMPIIRYFLQHGFKELFKDYGYRLR